MIVHLGSQPAISVVVPVRNRLNLLRETTQSLLQQTLTASEFIFVDDRSDAEVLDFLRHVGRTDSRVRVIEKPPSISRGAQTSRNLGLDAARGEGIVFLDSDDLLTPRCLEVRAAELLAVPEVDLLVGRQAIMDDSTASLRWVNVPKREVNDIDRFVQLGQPLDVPWVNAGVTLRRTSVQQAEVRWRPEFDWDDVAFHFECLVKGLRTGWRTFEHPPDAFYRRHSGERYGRALFTRQGMLRSAEMIFWMYDTLRDRGQLSKTRRDALARSFFHTCVLRAIDMHDHRLAKTLLQNASETDLVDREMRRFQSYASGRRALGALPRLTYYWNRLFRARIIPSSFSAEVSSYGACEVNRGGRTR